MDSKQVMAHLEKAGTAQARKIYLRHGHAEPMFGVSFAELNALKKKIKTDQALAEALWASGNSDAKILAAMVADPAKFTPSLQAKWVRETNFRGLRDYVGCTLGRSPGGAKLAEKLLASKEPSERMMGYSIMANLGRDGTPLPLEVTRRALEAIEREIHTAENWSRYGMMYALIGIGGYNPELRKDAVAAARRIGKVEFDPGETNCKMPDPVPHIAKMAARAAAKGKGA